MTKNKDNSVNKNQEYNPEKFSEPRTMPKGWDLSGLVKLSSHGKPNKDHNQQSEQTDANNGTDDTNWFDDKFSEPRTTPKNWDVSALK